jgi:hypothetical protein
MKVMKSMSEQFKCPKPMERPVKGSVASNSAGGKKAQSAGEQKMKGVKGK